MRRICSAAVRIHSSPIGHAKPIRVPLLHWILRKLRSQHLAEAALIFADPTVRKRGHAQCGRETGLTRPADISYEMAYMDGAASQVMPSPYLYAVHASQAPTVMWKLPQLIQFTHETKGGWLWAATWPRRSLMHSMLQICQ